MKAEDLRELRAVAEAAVEARSWGFESLSDEHEAG